MTFSEVVKLVRLIEAIQPAQKIDEFTADAWTPLLADVSGPDAFDAVRELGRRQLFIAPADIIAEVRRVRAERFKKIDPVLPPYADPDDVHGYIRALRRQNHLIAENPDLVQRKSLPGPKSAEQAETDRGGMAHVREVLAQLGIPPSKGRPK